MKNQTRWREARKTSNYSSKSFKRRSVIWGWCSSRAPRLALRLPELELRGRRRVPSQEIRSSVFTIKTPSRAREVKSIILPYNKNKSRKHPLPSQRVPRLSPSTWAACIWIKRCNSPCKALVTIQVESPKINWIAQVMSLSILAKIFRHRAHHTETRRTQAVLGMISPTLKNRATPLSEENPPKQKTRRTLPNWRHKMTNSIPRPKNLK